MSANKGTRKRQVISPMSSSNPKKHLTQRSMMLFFAAIVTAVGAGVLMFGASHVLATAVLAGFAAFGTTFAWLDRIVEGERERRRER